jgi:hypothetical protein
LVTSPASRRWKATRRELLRTRICDLGLKLAGSPLERFAERLKRELHAKGLRFRPEFYLADSWGCPDRTPVVGIPFYLADRRLSRIEKEKTGRLEDSREIMMLLRHEAGHAVNYAYRLWQDPEWREVFGAFTRPYREAFRPRPRSRRFVRHLSVRRYGPTYAQKHPDEDFAETFAVWLTPRSGWRKRYRGWPAMRKLEYVDELMHRIGRRAPRTTGGKLFRPVERLGTLLAGRYGRRGLRRRSRMENYLDGRLRRVFPPTNSPYALPAEALLRRHRRELRRQVASWSGASIVRSEAVLARLACRAGALGMKLPRSQGRRKLRDVTAVAAAIAMTP